MAGTAGSVRLFPNLPGGRYVSEGEMTYVLNHYHFSGLAVTSIIKSFIRRHQGGDKYRRSS